MIKKCDPGADIVETGYQHVTVSREMSGKALGGVEPILSQEYC